MGRAAELTLITRFQAGEPGIGKTRLLREAVAQGAAGGWTVLEGSSSARRRRRASWARTSKRERTWRAREEWEVIEVIRPAMDALLHYEYLKTDRALAAAQLHDDPQRLDFTCLLTGRDRPVLDTLNFLSERGLLAPLTFLDGARDGARDGANE